MSLRYGDHYDGWRHGDDCEDRGFRFCVCASDYADAGFLGELLRAISDSLSRLVGPGDVGVV